MPLLEGDQYHRFLQDNYHDFQEAEEVFKQMVANQAGQERILLNLGCGRRSSLSAFYPDFRSVIGLDPDSQALDKHPGLTTKIIGQVEKMPLADASVDLVAAEWVLEHLTNPEFALREISRVLKPGGVFIFLTPNLANPFVLGAKILSFLRLRKLLSCFVSFLTKRPLLEFYPLYYRINTPSRLEVLSRRVQLNPKGLRNIGAPGYWRFSKKLLWLSLWLEKKKSLALFRMYLVGEFQK